MVNEEPNEISIIELSVFQQLSVLIKQNNFFFQKGLTLIFYLAFHFSFYRNRIVLFYRKLAYSCFYQLFNRNFIIFLKLKLIILLRCVEPYYSIYIYIVRNRFFIIQLNVILYIVNFKVNIRFGFHSSYCRSFLLFIYSFSQMGIF